MPMPSVSNGYEENPSLVSAGMVRFYVPLDVYVGAIDSLFLSRIDMTCLPMSVSVLLCQYIRIPCLLF